MGMESEVSVAVKIADPLVTEVTVNWARPALLVVADTVVIVSVAPREELTEMVFPGTAFWFPSFKRTLKVVLLLPSAITKGVEAVMMELLAETLPGLMVKVSNKTCDPPLLLAVTVKGLAVRTRVGVPEILPVVEEKVKPH